ncbi:MAG: glycosyltransferase [Armatimonadetes bacterium]|nr:glycosyltransferase [Armatimonadota bacterium]
MHHRARGGRHRGPPACCSGFYPPQGEAVKILHITNTVAAGGAEVTLLALCRHHKAAGVDLTVACLREHVRDTRSLRPEFERAGVAVRDLDCARIDPRCPWSLRGLIREERPDILHTHLPRADIAGIVARGRKPIPRVMTVHGTYGTQGVWRYLKPALAGVWRRADADAGARFLHRALPR